jgi:hypothetical protein
MVRETEEFLQTQLAPAVTAQQEAWTDLNAAGVDMKQSSGPTRRKRMWVRSAGVLVVSALTAQGWLLPAILQ